MAKSRFGVKRLRQIFLTERLVQFGGNPGVSPSQVSLELALDRLAEEPRNCVRTVQADSPEGVTLFGPLPGDGRLKSLVWDLIGREPVRRDREGSPRDNRGYRRDGTYSGGGTLTQWDSGVRVSKRRDNNWVPIVSETWANVVLMLHH